MTRVWLRARAAPVPCDPPRNAVHQLQEYGRPVPGTGVAVHSMSQDPLAPHYLATGGGDALGEPLGLCLRASLRACISVCVHHAFAVC